MIRIHPNILVQSGERQPSGRTQPILSSEPLSTGSGGWVQGVSLRCPTPNCTRYTVHTHRWKLTTPGFSPGAGKWTPRLSIPWSNSRCDSFHPRNTSALSARLTSPSLSACVANLMRVSLVMKPQIDCYTCEDFLKLHNYLGSGAL